MLAELMIDAINDNYIKITGSDRIEFLLDYDGSNYRAYLLNLGT